MWLLLGATEKFSLDTSIGLNLTLTLGFFIFLANIHFTNLKHFKINLYSFLYVLNKHKTIILKYSWTLIYSHKIFSQYCWTKTSLLQLSFIHDEGWGWNVWNLLQNYVIQCYLSKFDIIKLKGTFWAQTCRPMFPRWLRWWRICLSMQETWVWSLGWEDPLEKGMATHSSILAWRISWAEESEGHGVTKSWTQPSDFYIIYILWQNILLKIITTQLALHT